MVKVPDVYLSVPVSEQRVVRQFELRTFRTILTHITILSLFVSITTIELLVEQMYIVLASHEDHSANCAQEQICRAKRTPSSDPSYRGSQGADQKLVKCFAQLGREISVLVRFRRSFNPIPGRHRCATYELLPLPVLIPRASMPHRWTVCTALEAQLQLTSVKLSITSSLLGDI